MSAELQASRRDATLILTLSNPAANNALHPDIYAAAIETLSTAERDSSIRAVVLTGAGRHFCAGENLHRSFDRAAKDKAESLDQLQGWIDAIRDCPKPVIAAVEGIAANAGFSLALACDLMVAGTSAQFSMSQIRSGLTPSGGGSWFLLHAMPRQLALEILLEGMPVPAARLHELGMINKLVTDGTALDAALAWADTLAALAPEALERIKSLAYQAHHNTLAQQIESEKRHFLECLVQPNKGA